MFLFFNSKNTKAFVYKEEVFNIGQVTFEFSFNSSLPIQNFLLKIYLQQYKNSYAQYYLLKCYLLLYTKMKSLVEQLPNGLLHLLSEILYNWTTERKSPMNYDLMDFQNSTQVGKSKL